MFRMYRAASHNNMVPPEVSKSSGRSSMASGHDGSADSVNQKGDPDMKGYLLKWTNYLKGYQKRYFVLSKTVLMYFR